MRLFYKNLCKRLAGDCRGVTVEGYNKGAPLDLVKLDGTWRLQYTSAPDVLVLLEAAARVSFFQV